MPESQPCVSLPQVSPSKIEGYSSNGYLYIVTIKAFFHWNWGAQSCSSMTIPLCKCEPWRLGLLGLDWKTSRVLTSDRLNTWDELEWWLQAKPLHLTPGSCSIVAEWAGLHTHGLKIKWFFFFFFIFSQKCGCYCSKTGVLGVTLLTPIMWVPTESPYSGVHVLLAI